MLQMTRGSNKESRRAPVAVTWLCALSSLGAACESRLVVCLHWLFSLANPSGGVAFRLLIPFRCRQCDLVPLSEFIPAADNYSKFGECLQGAASRCGALFPLSRLPQITPFLYFSARFSCVCVS